MEWFILGTILFLLTYGLVLARRYAPDKHKPKMHIAFIVSSIALIALNLWCFFAYFLPAYHTEIDMQEAVWQNPFGILLVIYGILVFLPLVWWIPKKK